MVSTHCSRAHVENDTVQSLVPLAPAPDIDASCRQVGSFASGNERVSLLVSSPSYEHTGPPRRHYNPPERERQRSAGEAGSAASSGYVWE
jgi:hypothetical protein